TTNMLLTEAVTVPFGILLICSIIELSNAKYEKTPKFFIKWAFLWCLALTAYSVMILCKFNLAAFSLLFLYPLLKNGLFISIRKWNWNFVSVSLIGILLIGTSYIAALSHYNYVKTGSLAPTSAVGRVFYWGAWHAVFEIRRENRNKPGLKEIYKSGSLYNVINQAQDECKMDFQCETPILMDKSMGLLTQAGIDIWQERFRSFKKGLLSGEKNELHATRKRFLQMNGKPESGPLTWFSNSYTKAVGMESALHVLNHAKEPLYIRGLYPSAIPARATDKDQRNYSKLTYLILLILLLTRRVRIYDIGVLGLIGFTFVALSVSIYLMDIWRFLQTGWTVCMLLLVYDFKLAIDRKKQAAKKTTP
ncbi:MAG: hypothetical protein AB7O96_08770, partial [Pseudobdellovibrionaceae bacterium]